MSYDDWKSREPDPSPEGRYRDEADPILCRDCGSDIYAGAMSTPHGTYCNLCGRAREAIGVLFDPRSIAEIAARRRSA